MAAPPKDEFGYAGMCDWYRKQIDSGVHTDVSEGKLLGVGGDDPAGSGGVEDGDMMRVSVDMSTLGDADLMLAALGDPTAPGTKKRPPLPGDASAADLNDVRPMGSESMEFYSQNIFRWTHKKPDSPVAKAFTGAGSGVVMGDISRLHEHAHWASELMTLNGLFGPWTMNDGFSASFDPFVEEHYMIAQQFFPAVSGSMVKIYWHTHHEYTYNQYLFLGSPSDLRLNEAPFHIYEFGSLDMRTWFSDPHRAINLTAHGLTVDLMEKMLVNRACGGPLAPTDCARLVCSMDTLGRWEHMPEGSDPSRRERYAPPNCLTDGRLSLTTTDPLTVVGLLKPQYRMLDRSSKPAIIFQHTAFYFYMIPDKDSVASELFPRAFTPLPMTSPPYLFFTLATVFGNQNISLRTTLLLAPWLLILGLLFCCFRCGMRCLHGMRKNKTPFVRLAEDQSEEAAMDKTVDAAKPLRKVLLL